MSDRCIKDATKIKSLEPFGNNVICIPDETEDRTKGGIVLPDTVKEKERPMRGTVLRVGPGDYDEKGHFREPRVKKGDKIYFARWGGTELDLEEGKVRILTEKDILCKIVE